MVGRNFKERGGYYDLASIEFVYPNSDGVRRRNTYISISIDIDGRYYEQKHNYEIPGNRGRSS